MTKGTAVLASVVLHLAMVGALVLLTKGGGAASPKPPVAFVAQIVISEEERPPALAVSKPRAATPLPIPVVQAPVQPIAAPVDPVPVPEAEPVPPPPVGAQPPSALPVPPTVVPASIVSFQKPKYPARLRTLGVEGVVRLQVVVSAEGHCQQAVVVQSSGYADMDSRALEAAKKATFQPQTVDSVPGTGTLNLTVRYSLE